MGSKTRQSFVQTTLLSYHGPCASCHIQLYSYRTTAAVHTTDNQVSAYNSREVISTANTFQDLGPIHGCITCGSAWSCADFVSVGRMIESSSLPALLLLLYAVRVLVCCCAFVCPKKKAHLFLVLQHASASSNTITDEQNHTQQQSSSGASSGKAPHDKYHLPTCLASQ